MGLPPSDCHPCPRAGIQGHQYIIEASRPFPGKILFVALDPGIRAGVTSLGGGMASVSQGGFMFYLTDEW